MRGPVPAPMLFLDAVEKQSQVAVQRVDMIAAFLHHQGGKGKALHRLSQPLESGARYGNLRLRVFMVDVETQRKNDCVGLEPLDGGYGCIEAVKKNVQIGSAWVRARVCQLV